MRETARVVVSVVALVFLGFLIAILAVVATRKAQCTILPKGLENWFSQTAPRRVPSTQMLSGLARTVAGSVHDRVVLAVVDGGLGAQEAPSAHTPNGLVETERGAVQGRMVSTVLAYGLGNQLFQMAAAFGVGARTGRQVVIHRPSIHHGHEHSAERYWETLFAAWPVVNTPVDAVHDEGPEMAFTFRPIPDSEAQHLQLQGFFQQETYVAHARAFIDALTLPQDLPILENTCFIHIRLGDYVGNARHDLHLADSYLGRALAVVRGRCPGARFLVFSNSLESARQVPQLRDAVDVDFNRETNEVRCLVQMSRCLIGGICWNSTFSWWGAFMNDNPQKVIVMPETWVNETWETRIQMKGAVLLPAALPAADLAAARNFHRV